MANFNYKKVIYYHVGTNHYILLWNLTIEKCDYHHFLTQFNMEFYNVIQAFQGEKMTNALGHMKNIHVEGNVVYTPPTIRLNTKDYVAPQTSLMQELLGDD